MNRDYQVKAQIDVEKAWATGARSVLLVAPTGAGKTHMGAMIVGQRKTLWIAHRRELVLQAAQRLRSSEDLRRVGFVMAGEPSDPGAHIHVGTVQTIANRDAIPGVEMLVLDEAHHYLADHWKAIIARYPGIRTLGLTATPERSDGKALGDIFDHLVVGATYSQLIAQGQIVPARVLRAPEQIGSDLALAPAEAYLRYGLSRQAILFLARIEQTPQIFGAKEAASELRDYGTAAEFIEESTPQRTRDSILARFRSGRLQALTNVALLCEGFDAPMTGCVVLARNYVFRGAMMQACGRALRAADGKADAIVIDLCGCTHRLGMPDQDVDYSLQGRAITPRGPREPIESPETLTQSVRGLQLELAAPGALPPGSAHPVMDMPVRRERGFEYRSRGRKQSAEIVAEMQEVHERFLSGMTTRARAHR